MPNPAMVTVVLPVFRTVAWILVLQGISSSLQGIALEQLTLSVKTSTPFALRFGKKGGFPSNIPPIF